MSVYLKRYGIWTVAYIAAIIALFWGTDLHLSWWQLALLVLAICFHGAAQRNIGRWEER
jgi:hypothetical protein